ncbi:MAG TPA: DEAD/DEAH box helicase [Kiritimatiellia bacterium]|nr:DEAD/DEAH box helicase [Kiritimatiellia bacterium]
MSVSIEHARSIVRSLQEAPIPNFIAQSKAKQLLKEVHEIPLHFPQFTPGLDDRGTFIAYRMLAAGCSFSEQGLKGEGDQQLHAAGDLLESIHRTGPTDAHSSRFHRLIGAMAFYACGHYSRAYVLIKAAETVTPGASVIASFLRKDSVSLITRLNELLLQAPESETHDVSGRDATALDILIGRAVALVFENTISGDAEALALADATLRDAMLISEASAQPSYWWIARILRLMFKDYRRGSLWSVLPPAFGPEGAANIADYTSLLALSKPPVTELWRSQLAALALALNEEHSGGVVNLRTSAGKTRVAELAILKVLKADPAAKVLYLAPFRSLAFELERTFVRSLGALGYSISHLYGGSRFSGVDRELVVETNLLIATPEKTKAMLRAAPELFDSVKLIVIDEGHLLGESERNVRNELFLEHLRVLSRRKGSRILLLSAVLPNAGQLASWIGGSEDALAQSQWKPSDERFGVLWWRKKGVQLEWRGESRCFNPNFVEFRKVVEPGKKRGRKFPKNKTEAVAATATRLADLGPVMIFAAQARWVPSMARAVLLALQAADTPSHQWPETEWKLFEAVCSEEMGSDCIELEAARVGVVCHSNRLPPQVRMALEKLMASGQPRIIVATTTLGQGVNIGVSSVIVSQTLIGQDHRISGRDFWNICGRAGRAFVDGEGKVLFAIDATKAAWQVRNETQLSEEYLNILTVDKVQSGLLQVIRALRLIAERAGVSFETLLELSANGDFGRLGNGADQAKALTDLVDDQLLTLHAAHQGCDPVCDQVDWVEEVFRGSLAAIQADSMPGVDIEQIISLMKARTTGVLRGVPSALARKAIISSGLPLSVGVLAFRDLEIFRNNVDVYLAGAKDGAAIEQMVSEFEDWAMENANAICDSIASKDVLNVVRGQWIGGTSLLSIRQSCEDDPLKICTGFYGYELSWLFHAVAQKLDPEAEVERRAALELVSLLLELGLPNEAASKVFLAGIRSRAAAVELGTYVVDASASPKRIRNALLNPETVKKLKPVLSDETASWLDLLAGDQTTSTEQIPAFPGFKLAVPKEVTTLHARMLPVKNTAFLCSTNCRYVFPARTTEDLPFHTVANDPRFVFLRTDDHWRLHCRDPRLRPRKLSSDNWIF